VGRGPGFLGGDEAADAAKGLPSCFLLFGDIFMFYDGEASNVLCFMMAKLWIDENRKG
jgi:hypothetical protein